jgi:hypothetical protein
MGLPSIREPAIFKRLMVDGTFAIEAHGWDLEKRGRRAESHKPAFATASSSPLSIPLDLGLRP